MTAPRFVMLTAGTKDARELAILLARAGVECEIVAFAYPAPARRNLSASSYAIRRLTAFFKRLRILRAVAQRSLPRFPRRPRYVGYCNGTRMLRELRSLAPDYIIMMGGCILSPEIIATAKQGVLNAHPGILPWARGMNVMEHSLFRDVALGATGHFIDRGIDTGPILLRYLLPVADDTTQEMLPSGLITLCVGIMFEMVSRLAKGEHLAAMVQQEKFPYCRRLTLEEHQRAADLMRSGKVRELYLKWRTEYPGIPDGAETIARVSGGELGVR